MRFFGGGPRFHDDGTQSPQATGNDKLFPDDCGRDENEGTGKLCFPDGLLCQNSKYLFVGLGTTRKSKALIYFLWLRIQSRLLSFHFMFTDLTTSIKI